MYTTVDYQQMTNNQPRCTKHISCAVRPAKARRAMTVVILTSRSACQHRLYVQRLLSGALPPASTARQAQLGPGQPLGPAVRHMHLRTVLSECQ